MNILKTIWLTSLIVLLDSCGHDQLILMDGVDDTAGVLPCYIITTPTATYYLEKTGGGLSSLLDKDGVDWLGFNNTLGSGHKGEYRGFPNAVHKQDGNYFHAMNTKTDPCSSFVAKENFDHIQIVFISENQQWQCSYDFYKDRCDFTMNKISKGYQYWVQYEGVPGGAIDSSDFWMASIDQARHNIFESQIGDLPAPEWMAFGDQKFSRMLYVFHHDDDNFPDNYVCRPDMTVLGFGRENKNKFLTTLETFSIGFVESTDHQTLQKVIQKIMD